MNYHDCADAVDAACKMAQREGYIFMVVSLQNASRRLRAGPAEIPAPKTTSRFVVGDTWELSDGSTCEIAEVAETGEPLGVRTDAYRTFTPFWDTDYLSWKVNGAFLRRRIEKPAVPTLEGKPLAFGDKITKRTSLSHDKVQVERFIVLDVKQDEIRVTDALGAGYILVSPGGLVGARRGWED